MRASGRAGTGGGVTFAPRFTFDAALVSSLLRVEAARAVVDVLPIPPDRALPYALTLRHETT